MDQMDKSVLAALRLEKYNMDIDKIRHENYPMLENKTYMDHAGTTIPSKLMNDMYNADINSRLYGNPHSEHKDSKLTSQKMDEVRKQTLQFFRADPELFDCVFVANASAAIKLVGDCFRDASESSRKGFWLGYHRDCHTSVVGLREATKGRHHCFENDQEVLTWIGEGEKNKREDRKQRSKGQLGLFAYPGQSNMTGRRLPLEWSQSIRSSHLRDNMYIFLDAAGLATCCQIDLSDPGRAPDFMSVSFYKIFGGPNLGALIVKKSSGDILRHRKDFGGGAVDMVIAMGGSWHAKKDSLHERLEYGTLPFQNIIQLGHAFNAHKKLFGSMTNISRHTSYLTRLLYDNLTTMKHKNGKDVIVVYNDISAHYGQSRYQGGNIAFNVLAADGSLVGYTDVEKKADEYNISIRSGSLCNPGGFAHYLDWSPEEMRQAYDAGHRCSNPTQIVMGKPTGVVRASLGAMSNLADVNKFLRFLENNYIDLASSGVTRLRKIPQHNTSCIDLGSCGSDTDGGSRTHTLRSFDLSSSTTSDNLNDPMKMLRTRMSVTHLNRPATGRTRFVDHFAKLNPRNRVGKSIA